MAPVKRSRYSRSCFGDHGSGFHRSHASRSCSHCLSRPRGSESARRKDYHDRMVRNLEHFANCAKYIRGNPAGARLRDGEYLLYESAAVREMLAR